MTTNKSIDDLQSNRNTKDITTKISLVLLIALILTSSFLAFIYIDLRQDYQRLQTRYDAIQDSFGEIERRLNFIEALSNTEVPSSDSDVSSVIYELVEPSVVEVTVTFSSLSGSPTYGSGSGFVYSGEGYIITNYHVIAEADTIEVTFLDGETIRATLIGQDQYSDLAVLKVEPHKILTPVTLGDSLELLVGETVLAIGNPFGLSGSMTKGVISQLQRSLQAPGNYRIVGVIQVDAAINPGNSGGPLINMRGEVVGVNTAIASSTGEFAGIGFAIPSALVVKVVPALIEQGYYPHPWLGISGLDVISGIAEAMNLPSTTGFLLTDIIDGGPADKAGLQGGYYSASIEGVTIALGGDVIIGVDQIQVRKLLDLSIYIEYQKTVGDTVSLTILREGDKLEIPITLSERPPP